MISLTYLHPIAAGFPFPLFIAAFLTELMAYFALTNHWRNSAFFLVILASICSVIAYYSGFYQVGEANKTFIVDQDLITRHQAIARVQTLSLIPLLLFGLIRSIKQTELIHWIYVPFLILSLILTGATSHRGGMLVFEQGAGISRPCEKTIPDPE
ncbi:MAG TPA: hypothetical protein PKA63_03500 [Oligoflexia bacterium]|nr:hypothetical protein [Oligoflexia bacterium]HMP47719.1 hypothetical protein [Oligoflexia bacterium]